MDYCKYVNVFQGCGEIDLPKPEGIAAKWFFIKAGCGNTSPAACVPFSAMSVSPYTGGYPTGYGDHKPNSHSHPAHFKAGKKLLGFAHLQQSGTGAIGFYYNYALTVPRYDTSPRRRDFYDEKALPGYYCCTLEDIKCELTSTNRVACHRYSFGKNGGSVSIDFSNNGLDIYDVKKKKCTVKSLESPCPGTAVCAIEAEGITLYFAVKGSGNVKLSKKKAVFSDFGKRCIIKTAISLESEEKALEFLNSSPDFNAVKNNAYNAWNDALSAVTIKTNSKKIKEIFYSNLYHSFIKPADFSGDSFIYGSGKPFTVDLATLWDMYKTALPLIFMTNKDIGEKITETLLLLGESIGEIPNSIGLSDGYTLHDSQARTLGCYALLTAYRYGVKLDAQRMINVIRNDIFADNKKDFTVDGRCGSYTWLLDMADACALASQAAREIGDNKTADALAPHAEKWKTAYSEETGLLKGDSDFYEGTLYNYSFRQMVNMKERIALAGGNEKFVKLLDDFFGYGAPDTVQPTDPHNYAPVEEGMKLGRFEGFNNESDTESPFSYVYAGRHDRTCEIIRAGMKYMFTTGRGGIPGNNDSDALSSYYVFAALGLFPVAGQDLFIIGSPFVDEAEIKLFNGKKLKIEVENCGDKNIYVKEVKFNGKKVKNFMLAANKLMNGGTLEFTMTADK